VPLEIATPHGPALAHLRPVDAPRGALVLGHGASGGVGGRDLAAVADVAAELGLAVALVGQPYRVAGRRSPAPSRQPELDAVAVPVLVVQGTRDAFGMPEPAPGRRVVAVRADHALRTDLGAVAEAVRAWLGELLAA